MGRKDHVQHGVEEAGGRKGHDRNLEVVAGGDRRHLAGMHHPVHRGHIGLRAHDLVRVLSRS